MSKRWKTAIFFGILWGFLMMVFSICFDLQEKAFHQIIASNGFWIRWIGYTVLGIFPVGYFSYRGKKED